MPTEGTRTGRVGLALHRAPSQAGSAVREWWDAACGLLPAVVLAAGCFAGAQYWLGSHAYSSAPASASPALPSARPLVAPSRPEVARRAIAPPRIARNSSPTSRRIAVNHRHIARETAVPPQQASRHQASPAGERLAAKVPAPPAPGQKQAIRASAPEAAPPSPPAEAAPLFLPVPVSVEEPAPVPGCWLNRKHLRSDAPAQALSSEATSRSPGDLVHD